jgi:hypothetical protein
MHEAPAVGDRCAGSRGTTLNAKPLSRQRDRIVLGGSKTPWGDVGSFPLYCHQAGATNRQERIFVVRGLARCRHFYRRQAVHWMARPYDLQPCSRRCSRRRGGSWGSKARLVGIQKRSRAPMTVSPLSLRPTPLSASSRFGMCHLSDGAIDHIRTTRASSWSIAPEPCNTCCGPSAGSALTRIASLPRPAGLPASRGTTDADPVAAGQRPNALKPQRRARLSRAQRPRRCRSTGPRAPVRPRRWPRRRAA